MSNIHAVTVKEEKTASESINIHYFNYNIINTQVFYFKPHALIEVQLKLNQEELAYVHINTCSFGYNDRIKTNIRV